MELKQYLKMSQQLVMTPQLQQAIKLLQLSRMELAETISNELLENPVLEQDGEAMSSADVDRAIESEPGGDGAGAGADGGLEGHGADEFADRQGLASDDGYGSGDPFEGRAEAPGGAAAEAEAPSSSAEGEQDWERFIENYNDYSYTPGEGGVRLGGDDDMPTLEQTLAGHSSLADHLEWQLHQEQLTDAELEVALEIIGNLSDAGFFNRELLEGIGETHGLELDEAEAVLEVVQEFDPIGVAAGSLQETLLIQAKHYYPNEDLTHAIIERHLEHLEKKQVPPILKDLGCEVDDISDAVAILSTLEPRPARMFQTDETQYITPDVYITKVGDEYIVTLNEDGLPKLRISNFYEQQIKSGQAKGEEKSFIQDKFRSAMWLIRSIHQRQSTIRKVTESIGRFQREFLDQGVEYLRPLILRDVADDIGMHESTISRVTTNKYVHTPQGIFELKYFFNSRITSSSGEDLASESVKQRIKKLIAAEDPKKPLSDQKLCNILGEEGTEIARRTVAKYREMLGIPPSSKRKKVF